METRSPGGQELHPKQEPPQSCKADSSTAESWRVLWSLSRKGKPGLFQHVGRCSLINGPGTEPPAASGLRVARVQPRPEAGQVAEQGGLPPDSSAHKVKQAHPKSCAAETLVRPEPLPRLRAEIPRPAPPPLTEQQEDNGLCQGSGRTKRSLPSVLPRLQAADNREGDGQQPAEPHERWEEGRTCMGCGAVLLVVSRLRHS